MKAIFVIIIFQFFMFVFSHAQDKIISKEGKQLVCSIKSVDESQIQFTYKKEGQEINSSINIEQISAYIFKNDTIILRKQSSNSKYVNALFLTDPNYMDSIENKHHNFLIKKDFELVASPFLKFNDKLLLNDYFSLGDKKFYKSDLRFVKSGDTFLVNTFDINASHGDDYAIRVGKGKVNLYERYIYDMSTSAKQTYSFYNIGFGPLKKAKYKNLLQDFGHIPECSLHLEELKKKNKTTTVLAILGSAAFIGGGAWFYNMTKDVDDNSEEEPNIAGPTVLFIAGSVTIGISYVINLKKPQLSRNLINSYNRVKE